MLTDIKLDLMRERKRPAHIFIGYIYVVIMFELAYRVRIDHNMYIERQSLCFFIDVGIEKWINMDEIYECKQQFLKFPAQAICLSLFGLEDFAENPSANEHLLGSMFPDRPLIGVVLSNQDDYEAQEAFEDQSAKIGVCLFDTSSEEDILLNDVILTMICDSYVAPALQPMGYTDVVISHVDDEGAVFCQLQNSVGLQYVQKLIHHIVNYDFNQDQYRISGSEIVPEINSQRAPLYLVEDSETGKWYRATFLERNGNQYRMFYVDFGMIRLVNGAKMFRLDSLSTALNRYPHQAIICRLHGIVTDLRYLKDNTPALVSV